MQLAEIKTLSVEKRMQMMEDIWDSLRHENTEITSPLWHKKILQDRIQLIQSGKAKFLSIQELKSKYL